MSLFEKEKMYPVLFVTRMVVMSFVRATCSRGGSVCKDWFDNIVWPGGHSTRVGALPLPFTLSHPLRV